ncbi:uncharacterized protein LOC119562953 [Drosophila subpulchrella]|uniref:uncharacterized protein LOC119562953 n=1 Tax=Drosophila subpulchrella TaxID=1486046 RepID=UPI0018A15EB8|nr:uncharacterized protein LOC119562953 [Drosophila subpulchrella]
MGHGAPIFRHGAGRSKSGSRSFRTRWMEMVVEVECPGCRDEDVELLIRFSADMHFSQQGAAAMGTPGALIPAPSNCCSGWGCSEPELNRSALGFTNFGFN